MLWDVLATPAPDICDGSDDICFPIPMFFRFFLGASISFPFIL